MRFSLKDLLAIVAFCAVVLACGSYVGFNSEMFWIGIAVSLIPAGLFIAEVGGRAGYAWVFIAIITCGIIGLGMSSILTFINSAILFCFAIYSSRRQVPAKVRSRCLMAASSLLFAVVVVTFSMSTDYRNMLAWRREFPMVSLEKRLAYEQRGPSAATNGMLLTNISVSKGLETFEDNLESQYRQHALGRLHSESYRQFVNSLGLGVSRMGPVREESLRTPPLQNIEFDATTAPNYGMLWEEMRAFLKASKSNTLEHLHFSGRADFLDPNWFGSVTIPIKEVAGFISHAFHYPPAASLEDPKAFVVDRLELVSLLKFAEPRVYVLDHLPRMDQLAGENVPTRELDTFEAEALPKLRTEEDVVISQDGANYRMLGSLRAAKQCLDCHSVQRGELLGAFSYAIRAGAKGEKKLAADGE